MSITKQQRERVTVEMVDVVRCDQCGVEVAVFDESLTSDSNTWVSVSVLRDVQVPQRGYAHFCSASCTVTYFTAQMPELTEAKRRGK